jgi:hypothetical protein
MKDFHLNTAPVQEPEHIVHSNGRTAQRTAKSWRNQIKTNAKQGEGYEINDRHGP